MYQKHIPNLSYKKPKIDRLISLFTEQLDSQVYLIKKGSLCTKYFADNYEKKLNLAIAGRDKKKLEALSNSLNRNLTILIADSGNIDDL